MNNSFIKIIKIEPYKSRMLVTLDCDISFVLYKGEIKKFRLKEGDILDCDKLNAIYEVLYKRARERALYMLDDSYKTKKQIVDKLILGKYPENIINKVIEYLEEYDMINDFRYAMLYIEYKGESKSKIQIIQDLYKKGIKKDTVDMAFEESEFSDKQSLKKIIKKKITKYNLEDKKELNKFYRFLLSKGYKYDDIKRELALYNQSYNIFE